MIFKWVCLFFHNFFLVPFSTLLTNSCLFNSFYSFDSISDGLIHRSDVLFLLRIRLFML